MKKEEQLYKQLFDSDYQRLCRYAFTYLHDEQSSEDVVQETFVKIWEQKQELLGTPNISYYLITAVRNNCISYLRKLKNTDVVGMDHTPEPEPEIGFSKQMYLDERAENEDRISKALQQLPPKCREVFLLIKLHNLSYKDCAKLLQLSVKTVENQMSKAIKIFKALKSPAVVVLLALHILFVLK